jgi:hypothetical protein
MRPRWFLVVSAALVLAAVYAQSPLPTTLRQCSGPHFRAFDFWIGEWDVRDRSGKLVGKNSIVLEQNGCLLIERWRASSGNTGMSMNYYDPQARLWKQNWVSPGVVLHLSGDFRDGAMNLEGPLQEIPEARVTLLRGVWTKLPDGRVRQLFTQSADSGKTWQEWFDGYYTRVDR